MKIQAELKEGTSKTGKKYIYLSIMLTPTYEKKIFLESAEVELLKVVAQNTK